MDFKSSNVTRQVTVSGDIPLLGLTAEQGKRLLESTSADTLRGKRNHAILLLLIGCGLRRAELLGLTMNSIQLREEHWVIGDLRPTYGLRHPAAGSNPSAWKTSRSCIAFCGMKVFRRYLPINAAVFTNVKFHMAEFTAGRIGSARREALK